MKELHTEVIRLALGGETKSRLRVTCEQAPHWFARVLLGAQPYEFSAICEGTGSRWYLYEKRSQFDSRVPVGRELATLLESIEARLLAQACAAPTTNGDIRWVCPRCQTLNMLEVTICVGCSKPLDTQRPLFRRPHA